MQITADGPGADVVFEFMDRFYPTLVSVGKPATWMMCEIPTTKEIEHNGQ